MDAWAWILIVVVAVVVIVACASWITVRRRRRRMLHERFGPEYDRSVESARSHREAESELAGRAKQVTS